jgi:tetratricopeptide (TPR) repeat protein
LAEKVASEAESEDLSALELLERLYLEIGDSSAASETIGRQLMVTEHATARSMLWRRRARMYRELGREPQAYRCLKEAHACDPDHPDHAYELRCAAMARREWGLAASLLLGEIAAATADRDRAALHFELGLVFDERLGDAEQAIRNYEIALALDPTIPAVHAPLARQYEAQGRHREAAFHFEKAASSGGSLPISAATGVGREAGAPSPLFAIATDSGESSNPELAYQQEVPEPSPAPDLATLEQQLEDALTLGDRGAIRAAGRRLWQHSPGNAVAFSALAREYRADGDLWALIEITAVRAAMTAEGSQRAPLWIDVARLAEQLGEDPQAARAYDLALIEDPASPTALDARAGLAFRVGDFATAEMIYRDIEAADSILPADELLLRRSVIAESLERSDEALTFAQAAATAAPGRIELQRRVQELATRAGDLATALSAARSVMALVPPDQEHEVLGSHFTLVGLLHAIGDHAGAVANLEYLLRDHPGNRDVIAALASVQADRGDWTAACHYLALLVPLASSLQERALRLFELGEVFLTKVGDLERADDAFLRASDLDPGCVPALRRLVDSYWRADHLRSVVDITADLAARGALFEPEMEPVTLGRAALAVAIADDFSLAGQILGALGVEAAGSVVAALIELVGREHELTVGNACEALRVLHQAGVIDLHAIMAMAEHPEVRHQLHQAAQQ